MAPTARAALVLAAALALSGPTVVLGAGAPRRQGWAVRQWTVNDGLPQSSVTALLRSSDGSILVGTFGGLARFDGVRFVPLRVDGPGGLGSARVLALTRGRDGIAWVGVEAGGVGRLQGDRVVALRRPGPLATQDVSSIVVDRGGRVWVLSGRGVYRVETDEPVEVPLPGERPGMLTCLVEGKDGEILIGSDRSAIYRIGPGGTSRIVLPWPREDTGIFSLAVARNGSLWLGASGPDVGRYSNGSLRTWGRIPEAPTITRAVLERRDGSIWAAPLHVGLCRVGEEGLESVALPASRSGMVRTLMDDDEGGLWVGTESAGLFLVRPSAFTSWGQAEGMPDGPVHPVAVDASGDVWAGVACSGLVRIRDGVVESSGRLKGLRGAILPGRDCVWALLPARDGSFWIGTYSGRLLRLSRGKIEKVLEIERAAVVALFEDAEGGVWAGTRWAGLHRIRDGERRSYGPADGLPGNDVSSIAQGKDGRIWTAGSGGIAVLEEGAFRAIGPGMGLSSSQARVVVPEEDGTTWVGTYGGGMSVVRGNRVGTVDFAKGLPENVVSWIFPRSDGWVWFTGNRGVYRARRESLVAAAFGGAAAKAQVFRWGAEDGLPSSETNGGFQPAGWAGPDGTLFVPTIAGLASFHPEALASETGAVPVRIEEVVADGAVLAIEGGRALVPARTRRLVVRYATAALRPSERTFFRTRIEGFDPDWVDVGTRREAFLQSPRPGKLRLEVAACDEAGRWSRDAARIVLDVAPALHETTAFRLLAGLALVAAVAAVAGGRQAALSRRARDLSRLVDERTAELEAANRRLGDLAATDELTGLENVRSLRRRLDEEARRAVRTGRPLSLLMIDVDFFKRYNDALGHLQGDECLRRLAAVFREGLRDASDVACRYGGEEFAVLLPETSAEEAAAVAGRLCRAVESIGLAHPSSPAAPVVTVSVGVATSAPPHPATPHDLVAGADAALYAAKGAGRNRVASAPSGAGA